MCIFALYGHTATVCFSDATDARDAPTRSLSKGLGEHVGGRLGGGRRGGNEGGGREGGDLGRGGFLGIGGGIDGGDGLKPAKGAGSSGGGGVGGGGGMNVAGITQWNHPVVCRTTRPKSAAILSACLYTRPRSPRCSDISARREFPDAVWVTRRCVDRGLEPWVERAAFRCWVQEGGAGGGGWRCGCKLGQTRRSEPAEKRQADPL